MNDSGEILKHGESGEGLKCLLESLRIFIFFTVASRAERFKIDFCCQIKLYEQLTLEVK